jgi:hypothetical protein
MLSKNTLLLGAAGLAALVAYKWLNKIPQAFADATRATGEAVGSGLFDLFHPDQVGEMLFYNVHFSNANHAIASGAVDSQGRFTYQGVKYILRDKRNAAGIYEHWAFPDV